MRIRGHKFNQTAVYVKSSGGVIVPAKIQGALTQNGGSSSTTVAVTLGAPVTSGSLLCIAIGGATTMTGVSVTDDKSNTGYTVAQFNFGSFNWIGMYRPNITNGPTTITATFPEAHTFSTMIVTEFSGVLATSPLDGSNINVAQAGSNTTDAITSNATTTTANGDLIWGACVNLAGNSTLTKTSTFTQDQTQASNFNTEYLVQGTAGSIAATWTGTTADSFSSLMMAFKHA